MKEELKVETIEAAAGAAVEKIRPGTRYNTYVKFTFRAVYVLEDGRRIETNSDHNLKRDAVAELASLPKAPRWPTTAILEDGRLSMTTMMIGALSSLTDG